MLFKTFLNSVVKVKQLGLFSETSHAKMSPPFRLKLAAKMKKKASSMKNAGVLILFYPSQGNETRFVLILRKTYKGVHSAQIGFPGGKYEDKDLNIETTALRETEEEIGVPIDNIEIIKAMSPLYIPPSNFMAYPFLAFTELTPKFVKQDKEVESIIEVPLTNFLNPNNSITSKVATSYGVNVEVPAFKLNNHIVWGATAMMLSELKDLLNEVL